MAESATAARLRRAARSQVFASLQGYERGWLRGDLIAGLTLWAILVPQALAYASIAGVSPVIGLYALSALGGAWQTVRDVMDRREYEGKGPLVDVEGRPLVLFETDWHLRTAEADHPEIKLVGAVQPGRSSRAA